VIDRRDICRSESAAGRRNLGNASTPPQVQLVCHHRLRQVCWPISVLIMESGTFYFLEGRYSTLPLCFQPDLTHTSTLDTTSSISISKEDFAISLRERTF
jgi:hypothetical protein